MNLFGDDIEPEQEDDVFNDGLIATEGLLEPQSMQFCLGHEAQETLFLELFEKKSLPHAMIFSGTKGVGKSTMAFRLARFLLKNGKVDGGQDSLFGAPEPVDFTSLDVPVDDPVFSRVASGGHADLLHIHRYYDSTKGKLDASLKVEALRKIEPFLRRTASEEGGWRIVVVDDADTMNRNAQNAILKILEEPPANVLIILIAHRPGMLIPTIRSRARVIPFQSLPYEDMNDLIQKQGHNLPSQDLEILHILSEGSIGRAMSLIEEGGLETLSMILDHLDDFPNWNWTKIHKLSASLHSASQDKEYRMFAELMCWVFRHLLFAKAKGNQKITPYLQRDSILKIMNNYSLEKLVSVSDQLKSHFNRVEFSNLDRRDAVRSSFLVIHE